MGTTDSVASSISGISYANLIGSIRDPLQPPYKPQITHDIARSGSGILYQPQESLDLPEPPHNIADAGQLRINLSLYIADCFLYSLTSLAKYLNSDISILSLRDVE